MSDDGSRTWSQRLQAWFLGEGESSDEPNNHGDHPFTKAMERLVATQEKLQADFQRERVERYCALTRRIFQQTVGQEAGAATLRKTVASVEETGRVLQEFVALAELDVAGARRTRLLQRIELYLDRVVDEAEQALEALFDERLDDLSVDLELQRVVRGAEGPRSAPTRLVARRLEVGERLSLESEFPAKREFSVAFAWKLARASGRSPAVVTGRCIPVGQPGTTLPRSFSVEMVPPPRGEDLLRGQVRVRLVPKSIRRLVFVLAIEGAEERGHSFSQVEGLTFRLLDRGGAELAWHRQDEPFGSEIAIAAVELYRRGDEWRLRLRNEGSRRGLEGLGLPL